MKDPKRGNDFVLNISEFKAKALSLLSETARTGRQYLILKKGAPIARVVPVKPIIQKRRGSLAGIMKIEGQIVSFDTSKDWEAS